MYYRIHPKYGSSPPNMTSLFVFKFFYSWVIPISALRKIAKMEINSKCKKGRTTVRIICEKSAFFPASVGTQNYNRSKLRKWFTVFSRCKKPNPDVLCGKMWVWKWLTIWFRMRELKMGVFVTTLLDKRNSAVPFVELQWHFCECKSFQSLTIFTLTVHFQAFSKMFLHPISHAINSSQQVNKCCS